MLKHYWIEFWKYAACARCSNFGNAKFAISSLDQACYKQELKFTFNINELQIQISEMHMTAIKQVNAQRKKMMQESSILQQH